MSNYSSSSISSRIRSLRSRHLTTSKNIRSEILRPSPDAFKLQKMKRQRLKLKDEIAGYSFI